MKTVFFPFLTLGGVRDPKPNFCAFHYPAMNSIKKCNYQIEVITVFWEILKIYKGQNDRKHNRRLA